MVGIDAMAVAFAELVAWPTMDRVKM